MHDVASGDELMKAREGGNRSYPAFNRDGTLLASGTGEEIAVWDVASGPARDHARASRVCAEVRVFTHRACLGIVGQR